MEQKLRRRQRNNAERGVTSATFKIVANFDRQPYLVRYPESSIVGSESYRKLVRAVRAFTTSGSCSLGRSRCGDRAGPFARPALPGVNARMALSDSQCQPPSLPMALVPSSTDTGSPSLTRSAFPACRAPYPGGPSQCACRWLPGSCCLRRFQGGSASTTSLSRPAQASLALRPAGLLAHLTADFLTRLRSGQLPDRAAR